MNKRLFSNYTKNYLSYNSVYLNKNQTCLNIWFYFKNFVFTKKFILKSKFFVNLKLKQLQYIFIMLEFLKKLGII